MERARLSRSGSALIIGGAGAGKTTMAGHARAAAKDAGMLAFSARIPPRAATTQFRTLHDIVRPLLRRPGDPESTASGDRLGQQLADAIASTDAGQPLRCVDIAAQILDRRTGGRPVALILDDIHLADAGTRSILPLLLRRLIGTHVAVVLTSRGESVVDSGAAAMICSLTEHGLATRINLHPLTDDEISETVRGLLNEVPSEVMVTDLAEHTGRIPGVLTTIVDQLREEDRIHTDGNLLEYRRPLPAKLARAHPVVDLVHRLGPPAVECSRLLASLAGLDLASLRVAAAATGRDVEALGTALDTLVAADLVTLGTDGAYRVSPPVLASTLADDVGEYERSQAHSALVTDLLNRREGGERIDALALAGHFVGSDSGGLGEAVDVILAGARTLAGTQPGMAGDWYRTVLRRLPESDRRFALATAELGDLLASIGRWREVTICARAALDGDAQMDTPMRWRLGSSLLTALSNLGRYREQVEVAERLDDGVHALLRGQRALALVTSERFDEAMTVFASMVEPEDADDRAYWAGAMGMRMLGALTLDAGAYRRVTSTLKSMPNTSPASDAEDRIRDAVSIGDIWGAEAIVVPEDAHRRGGIPSLAGGRGTTRALGQLRLDLDAGRWDALLRRAEQCERDERGEETSYHLAMVHALAAEVNVRRENAGRAHEWLRDTTTEFYSHIIDWVQAGIFDVEGRAPAALSLLRAAIDRSSTAGYVAGQDLLWGRLIEIAHRAGITDQASAGITRLAEVAEGLDTDRARYLLAYSRSAVNSDLDEANVALHLALRRAEPFETARSQLLVATLGDQPEENLVAAYGTFRSLGATGWRTRTTTAMRLARIAVPRSRRSNVIGTEFTRQLARLVAEGRSNRQLATALGISVKTVEGHLTRIFAETGCRNRVDLANRYLTGDFGEITKAAAAR